MRRDERGIRRFSIDKNWNVEVDQYGGGRESDSFSGHLVRDTDFFILDDHADFYRFLLPESLCLVRCDAIGRPDEYGIYQWYLEYDTSGFEREWLIANNPDISESTLHPKPGKQCFVISTEYVTGKSLKLE
jgi:hypothetical protein